QAAQDLTVDAGVVPLAELVGDDVALDGGRLRVDVLDRRGQAPGHQLEQGRQGGGGRELVEAGEVLVGGRVVGRAQPGQLLVDGALALGAGRPVGEVLDVVG